MGQLPAETYNGDLAAAESVLRSGVGQSDDFRLLRFELGAPGGTPAMLVYLDGLIDAETVDQGVLPSLKDKSALAKLTGAEAGSQLEQILGTRSAIMRGRDYQTAVQGILEGGLVLLLQGCADVIVIGVARFPHRAVGKPETEHSVRGSREGFTETLGVNTALIRRRLKHPGLRIRYLTVGRWSRTRVAMVFLEGLTNPEIVRTVQTRLEAIDVDEVLDSHILESFLKDHPYTPFPLVRSTERPDEAVRALLSGKVMILTDNVPFALGVPSILMDFYQTMEDYVFGAWAATFVRLIRLAGWGISFFLPALYIALVAVNPEMVPNELAITVAHAREGLPFPPIMEVWIIETLIEMIREAALRLPQPLGITIGVVGGTVVGQAIVAAGIISPLMIIVAAVTMIASFTTPTMDMGFPWRILKWLLIFAAHAFGLLGLILGASAILAHLLSLRSVGIPYLAPFAPFEGRDMNDTVWRAPIFTMEKRPIHTYPLNKRKQEPYRQPLEHRSLRDDVRPPKEDKP